MMRQATRELIFWLLFFCVGFPLIIGVVCFLLNPDFWQGFRNTKYIDELNEENKHKDSKEIMKHE